MLNDDDKKYLEEKIETPLDNLTKKVNALEEASKESAKKRTTNPSKSNKNDKLTELREQDRKGENTLAQKIEMLNLSLKEAIPQDFKDAMVETGATVKKGAKAVGQGINKALTPLMMSNPITAMLYQNKDILASIGQASAGVAQMGFGLAKGAVKGTASILGAGAKGLFGAAQKLFTPKPKLEQNTNEPETTEQEKPTTRLEDDEKEPSTELSTAQKIDEMYKMMMESPKLKEKESKEQDAKEEKRATLLSKGLSGIGKTMKAINGVVDMVVAKQKLIIGGLLLGTIGVLSLVGWFKNGGLQAALKSALGLSDKAESGTPRAKSSDNVDSFVKTTDLSGKSNDEIKSTLQQMDGKVNKVGKQQTVNLGDAFKSGKLDKGLNGDLPLIDTKWNKDKQSYDVDMMEMENDKPIPFKLPFPVFIKEIKYGSGDHKKYATITIERRRKMNNPRVAITKVLQVLFPKNQDIPKDTVFAVVGENFQILGDWKSFMNTEGGYVDYKDYWSNNDKKFSENTAKARTDDVVKKQQDQQKKDLGWLNYYKYLNMAEEGTSNLIDKGAKAISGEKDTKETTEEKETPKASTTPVKQEQKTDVTGTQAVKQVPRSNLNAGNKTDNKVENQTTELKEVEKAKQQQQQQAQTQQAPPKLKPKAVIQAPIRSQENRPAELLDLGEYNAATMP